MRRLVPSAAVLALLATLAVPVAALAAAPEATTLGVTAVDSQGATLTGQANPQGLETSIWFEWGTDPALAAPVSTAPVSVGAGADPAAASAPLAGLTAGVTYYYRAVAENADGVARGAVDFFSPQPATLDAIVVNTADDPAVFQPGKISLREAVQALNPNGIITFDPRLDGARIELSIVGDTASALYGEVFTFSAGKWVFEGYQQRNYGKSALYAAKSLAIDASSLPAGITLAWAGGEAAHARVLAVLGDLSLNRVTVTGGYSAADPIPDNTAQPYTLARGGGLAVWGVATLTDCVVAGNRVEGDTAPGRDRGAFGGGIYADTLLATDSVVSGNSATGFGAGGGGIYSVGGVMSYLTTELLRCSVTGNRVTAQHAYGGGLYSDGGGPGNVNWIQVRDSTIARNAVADHAGLAESSMFQYYYRGGGIYMSNGYLGIANSTIVENAVTGVAAIFNNKPNMGGGGIAATIGDAHVVETMDIASSIIAGNTLQSAPSDVFTGSLLHFDSLGHNLFGTIDFTWMLVPIPSWDCLSRRHYPKEGDVDGVALADVVDLAWVRRDAGIVSAGTDLGESAVLWYPPRGAAVGTVPAEPYTPTAIYAGYMLQGGSTTDDFPARLLEKLRTDYVTQLGSDFGVGWDLSGVIWNEEASTWPSNPLNAGWIQFWHDVDAAIGDRLGTVRLGDDFWQTFAPPGMFGENVWIYSYDYGSPTVSPSETDQLGAPRLANGRADVGAVELAPPGAVALLAPSGAVPQPAPQFTWQAEPDADSYCLWIGTGSSAAFSAWYTAEAAGCAAGGTCAVTPATTLAAGAWFFNVKARNAAGAGPWAAPSRGFAVATTPTVLTLLAPAGAIGTPSPAYSWGAQAGATSYLLWVGTGSSTAHSAWYSAADAGCASGQTTCSVTPAVTLTSGSWYFNVRARNAAGTGPWAASKAFSVGAAPAPVTLLAPSGAAGTSTPAYSWSAQAGATSYLLWVGTGSTTALSAWYTAAEAGCGAGETTCSATPGTGLPNGTWFFNVKARSGAAIGPWTAAKRFTVP